MTLNKDDKAEMEEKLPEVFARAKNLPLVEKLNAMSRIAQFSRYDQEIFQNLLPALIQEIDKSIADKSQMRSKFNFLWLLRSTQTVPETVSYLEKKIQEEEQLFLSSIDPNKYIKNRVNHNEHNALAISDKAKDRLNILATIGEEFLKKTPEGIMMDHAGEQWVVEAFTDDAEYITVSSKTTPGKLITVLFKDMADIAEGEADIDSFLQRAEKNYSNEIENKAKIGEYNLPKNEKGVYIRIYPSKDIDTKVIGKTFNLSALMGNTIHSQYSNIDVPPILFSDDPNTDLRIKIWKEYEKGCKFFSLDFYNHGSKTSIGFQKEFSAKDMANLVREFPDAHFQLNTIACYGGGMREGLLQEFDKDPSLKERITAFLQTKADTPNILSDLRNPVREAMEINYASEYYLYLIKALNEGKSYGQAHIYADEQTKKKSHIDPEALYKGESIADIAEGISVPNV